MPGKCIFVLPYFAVVLYSLPWNLKFKYLLDSEYESAKFLKIIAQQKVAAFLQNLSECVAIVLMTFARGIFQHLDLP